MVRQTSYSIKYNQSMRWWFWNYYLKFTSRLCIVLRRVRLSLKKKGQWRKKWVVDSISWSQLHKGFNVSWKLCLNLCSLKWLKPSLSLVISLIPLGLRISKTEFGEGRMKLSIFSLKTEILLEFLRLGSKLFHSIIADGKKEFLKKLCFVLIREILKQFHLLPPNTSVWCNNTRLNKDMCQMILGLLWLRLTNWNLSQK